MAAADFLRGCGLPAAWSGEAHWRILEARFACGLNFLATWHAWREDAQRCALLHYAAIDAAPLAADELARAAGAQAHLLPLAEALAAQWRGLTPGFHRFAFEQGRVLLTLCVGETEAMLREQAFRADAMVLDGTDAAPPLDAVKAWTRLARRGTTLAASSSCAPSRADLQACGWRVDGPEHAPTVITARYDPAWEVKGLVEERAPAPSDAIVIGAGLAGAAVAASLARRGWAVRVLDTAAGPATGASDLPAGLLAPHQSPDDNPLSRLSRAGVRITLQEAQQRLAPRLEWDRTGALESRGDDRRPLPELGEALAPWSQEASEARKRSAGLDPALPAWWHENAAWIEPAALVRSWLRDPGVRFSGGRRVQRLVREGQRWLVLDAAGQCMASAALVVVAAAVDSAGLLDQRIQLHPVRGQVTWAPRGDDADALPPFPVNGHGHFLPRVPLVDRDAWITGSTYGRGDADESLRRADDAANLQRVSEVLPRAAKVVEAALQRRETVSWSGVRCASADRRPLVGELEPGLWVSTAMGSRGLSFAALAAELIAARLHGEPLPLPERLAQALDVRRWARPRSG